MPKDTPAPVSVLNVPATNMLPVFVSSSIFILISASCFSISVFV